MAPAVDHIEAIHVGGAGNGVLDAGYITADVEALPALDLGARKTTPVKNHTSPKLLLYKIKLLLMLSVV